MTTAIDTLRTLVSEKLASLPETDLVAIFQKIHGLKVDGDLGPVTERFINRPRFCGVKDHAAATRARWDNTLWTGSAWKPGVTPAQLAGALQRHLATWDEQVQIRSLGQLDGLPGLQTRAV